MNAPSLGESALSLPGVSFQFHVIMRLNRWGTLVMWQKYVVEGVHIVGPKPVISSWGPLILDRNVAPNNTWDDRRERNPVDPEEVRQTAEAVRRLPLENRDVITLEHTCAGSQEKKAEALGISRRTYCRRCQCGYTLLLRLMNDVAAGL